MSTSIALVNGVETDLISIGDRAFNYGHGLFETIRLENGRAPLWSWHQDRLCRDAPIIGVKVREGLLGQYQEQALALFPDRGVLKFIVTPGPGGGGYRDVTGAGDSTTYCVQYRELPESRTNICVQVSDYRLPHNPILAGVKHLNRLDQVMAARDLSAECDGLLLDSEGVVVEALSSNLFCRIGGQWLTPDLSLCGVRGVMREYLRVKVFPALGLNVVESRFQIDELLGAEAVFLCNAVRGIEPVSTLLGSALARVHWRSNEIVDDICRELIRQQPCFLQAALV